MNNPQKKTSKKISDNIMRFKGKTFTKTGRLTKKFKTFALENPSVLIPSQFVRVGDKFILKSKAFDSRFKTNVLKKKFSNEEKYKNTIKEKLEKFYLNEINSFEIDITKLSNGLSDFLKMVRTSERLLLTTKGNFDLASVSYVLNSQSLNRLLNDDVNQTESDAEFKLDIQSKNKFTVSKIGKSNLKEGGFFPYILNQKINGLDRYGIYDKVDKDNYNENCFIKALRNSNKVNDETIDRIKVSIKTMNLPMRVIKKIAEDNNLFITVQHVNSYNKINKYGDKTKDRIRLGIIENHYFIIEKTNYTSYSIKNYEMMSKKYPTNFNLYKKINEKTKTDFINSYALIKLLVENKDYFLKPLTNCNELYETQYSSKIKTFGNLEIDDSEYRPVIDKDKRKFINKKRYEEKLNTVKIWFDFETNVYKDKSCHIPYLCWCVDENDNYKEFIGEDCGKQLLIYLHNQYSNDEKIIKMIAHNASYDFRTGLFKYLSNVETIEKGSSLMSAKCKFYNYSSTPLIIKITDSYCIIPEPLRKFGKMFKLKTEKEIMPYPLYTTKNIQKKFIDINKCLSYIDNQDIEKYLDNCRKWGCFLRNEKYVDIIKYSSYYCKMDCKVLKDGYLEFKRMIKIITKLDIDDYISLASIADEYLKVSGCFDGCFELSGVCRSFIQECLVGGRTMLNNNKKLKRKGKIADYDAVSLYPSAMNRLKGFLVGIPIVLRKNMKTKEFLNNVDGYYIKIKIKSVGIKRDFPLLSFINEKGIRIFSNDIIDKEIYIDNISLEDAVKYQDIEYDILQGYFFCEGFNPKIQETISYLFNQRLKAKKSNNPIQAIYKLLMNSSYGKCALKEINEDNIYIGNKDYEKFVIRNYNYIKDITKTENNMGYRIKTTKPINKHFNRVHIGIQVLSMSKRIMNEVMCLSEDLKIKMFYQDTDSIHLDHKNVKPLEDEFRKLYNRELNGKNLGQFHVDFDLDGCKDIYSERFIGLGKKSYIDCLVGECPITQKTIRGYHIRMKGIPNDSIFAKCEELDITPLELYERLYKKESMIFDLLKKPNNQSRIRFEYKKDMSIHTVQEFNRKVKF